ncbi:MAG: hypothetical protein R3211_10635 [Balneolaceae bacterium]|nr:hypothetical protein [Balneolaceae bacterium]
MDNLQRKITEGEHSYRVRIMSCIVVAELIMLALITFWPEQKEERTYQDIVYTDQNILVEEVQITTQESSPPPPPKPQVPVPVPNDQVIEEQVLELEDIDLSIEQDPLALEGLSTAGNNNQVASNPQLPPSVVRIVEPTVPEAAKKANIKAEIWVSFLVNKKGEVEEATISQIRVYEDENDFRLVETINYGLPEATLEAALKWKFRPAKNNGQLVKAYTKHIFTYGF